MQKDVFFIWTKKASSFEEMAIFYVYPFAASLAYYFGVYLTFVSHFHLFEPMRSKMSFMVPCFSISLLVWIQKMNDSGVVFCTGFLHSAECMITLAVSSSSGWKVFTSTYIFIPNDQSFEVSFH